jgi:hypothetical protein
MSINRVPEVPFAQIANAALRDQRLSFKARGILAMVLSNVGEWEATANWIEQQSQKDGGRAVQTALKELTEHGYRKVSYQHEEGKVRTVVEWFHTPTDSGDISCPVQNVGGTKRDRHKTGGRIEHHPSEHYETEHQTRTLVRKPVDDHDPLFDEFWTTYPRRSAKGAARRAWSRAAAVTDPHAIIAGAARYASDPNREDTYTAHPATWLNGERWLDEPLPARDNRSERKTSEVADMIRRAALRDQGKEIDA